MSRPAGSGAAVLEPAVHAWLGRQLPGQRVMAAALLGGGCSNPFNPRRGASSASA